MLLLVLTPVLFVLTNAITAPQIKSLATLGLPTFNSSISIKNNITWSNTTNSIRYSRFAGRTRVTSNTEYIFSVYIDNVDVNYNIIRTCSGALISKAYVLTSASCIIDADRLYVGMGSASINPMAPIVFSEAHPIIYPHFIRNTHEHDIALLRALNTFILQSTIGTIVLPSSKSQYFSSHDFEGKNYRLVGYGRTTEGSVDSPISRNFVDMTVMDPLDCGTNMKRLQYKLYPHLSCLNSMGGSIGACVGDLGAPVFNWNAGSFPVIAGVVSDFLMCTDHTLFTRIGPYLSWIRQHATDA